MPATALPRPPVGAPPEWRFPAATRLTLGNGLASYLHHLPGQHVATMTCHLGVPLDAEPTGRGGIAGVMTAVLGTGTRRVTAEQFADRAAAAGITWSAAAGYTGPQITCQLPARQLPVALDLLGQALAEPAFEAAEVGRQVRLAIAGIARASAEPAARLTHLLPAAVFGDGSPAGRPAGGTPGSLARLDAGIVAAFHADCVRPRTTTVVIAGDLGGLDAPRLVSEALAGWDDPRPARAAGAGDAASLERGTPAAMLTGQPGAAQVRFLLAVPVPGRGHPDWPALQTAAYILGAPISGRLDSRLREQAGHSYAVRATLTELAARRGLLLISGAVAADAAVAAIGDVLAIVANPLRDGFSPAEVAGAIAAITRTVPLAYGTPAAVAAVTAELAARGLPADFADRLLADIAGLSCGRVSDAYSCHVDPGRLILLAAGDADTIAGPLRELVSPVPLQVS
jgi:predicted Zn-dependent peptidase